MRSALRCRYRVMGALPDDARDGHCESWDHVLDRRFCREQRVRDRPVLASALLAISSQGRGLLGARAGSCIGLLAAISIHPIALSDAGPLERHQPHSHGCPSAPAMQHSGGADVTVALHR